MKRKKNACFKKKKNPKLCIAVLCTEQEKQLYSSGLCLHYPGYIVKPC